MLVIFRLKDIFKPFRFEGISKLVIFQMPLEFNIFIFGPRKWDIVTLITSIDIHHAMHIEMIRCLL